MILTARAPCPTINSFHLSTFSLSLSFLFLVSFFFFLVVLMVDLGNGPAWHIQTHRGFVFEEGNHCWSFSRGISYLRLGSDKNSCSSIKTRLNEPFWCWDRMWERFCYTVALFGTLWVVFLYFGDTSFLCSNKQMVFNPLRIPLYPNMLLSTC